MKKVGVIDYGTGNLKSVVKAFEHLGAEVSLIHVSKDADEVDALIKKWIVEDKPYFGICLGLQVLFCSSEEGSRKGLGLFDGKVKRFRLGIEYKIPHMGWNGVYWDKVQNNPLVRGLTGGDQFYFVHSYHIQQVSDNLTTFKTSYGYDFISGIYSGNCVATQFHPEKSQEKGLQLYRNFLEKVV